ARGNGIHGVAFVAQDGGQGFANALFVIDDQEFGVKGHRSLSAPERSILAADNSATGNSIRKREPTGRLSSTRREPPCSEIMRAAMASPRPVPRSLVEKCGKKSLSLSCGE